MEAAPEAVMEPSPEAVMEASPEAEGGGVDSSWRKEAWGLL